MNILTIIKWLMTNWKIAAKAIYVGAVGILLFGWITTHNANKKLSTELEMATNNIEAYLGALEGSLLAFNVLKLDMNELSQLNDVLLHRLDSVRKANKIKAKDLHTAATHSQTLNVSTSKGVRGDIIQILKDTVYSDTIQYNDLTKVYYSVGKDSVYMSIDLKNTQYLYVNAERLYKNKKSFFKRLFTFDFKKVTKYKWKIVNTNDLVKEDSVRIVENASI